MSAPRGVPWWFLGAAAAGLLLRIFLLLDYLDSPFARHLILDARVYWWWAESVASGAVLPTAPFHQAPLYPYLLGAALRAFPGLSPVAVAGAQLLLNWATCLLLALAASRWAGRRVGLAAGTAALLFAPAAFLALKVLNATVGLFLATLAIALWPGPGRRGPFGAALSGGAWGLACLANAAFLATVPIVTAAALVPARRDRSLLRPLAAGIIAFLVVIAPVVAYNSWLDGGPVLISTNVGETLWQGNNPRAAGGYTRLEGISPDIRTQGRDTRALAEREAGRPLRPGEVSRHYVAKVAAYVLSDPLDFLGVEGRKLIFLLSGVDMPLEYNPVSERRDQVPLLWAFPIGPTLLMLAASLGIAAGAGRAILPFLAISLSQGLVVLLFFVSGRYSLPFQFFLIPAAAAGLLSAPGLRARPILAVSLAPVLIAGAMALSIAPRRNHEAVYLANLATILAGEDDGGRSRELFEKALEASPGDPTLLMMAGESLFARGELREAEPFLRSSLESEPSSVPVRILLAKTVFGLGRREEAKGILRGIVAGDPAEPEAVVLLADLHLQEGDAGGAEGLLRELLATRPGNGEARFLLSRALRGRGAAAEADRELAEAVRLAPDLAEAWLDLALAARGRGDVRRAAEYERKAAALGLPAEPGPAAGEPAP